MISYIGQKPNPMLLNLKAHRFKLTKMLTPYIRIECKNNKNQEAKNSRLMIFLYEMRASTIKA